MERSEECRSTTGIQEKIVKPQPEPQEPARRLGSVSRVRNATGYSRDGFCRFKALYEQGGEEALMGFARKTPVLKNRVPEHVERAVIEPAMENPARARSAPAGTFGGGVYSCRSSPALRNHSHSIVPGGLLVMS